MDQYWTINDIEHLEKLGSFDELANLAVTIVSRMKEGGQPIIQICGPMSTGGLGDLAKNMARFEKTIQVASGRGLTVFNQIRFQNAMIRLSNCLEIKDYCVEILEVFYRKVFISGHISKVLFLPDWESSIGAKWEREFAQKIGIQVEEYPLEWLNEIEF